MSATNAEHSTGAGTRAGWPVARWLRDYQREWLPRDAVAGVTLAAFAIPVSMAYATLAGLRYAREHAMSAPEAGARPNDDHPDVGAAAAPETVRDKPAPAPSATVPPQPNTTETDPPTNGA